MQVSVHNLGLDLPHGPQGSKEEKGVESDLVPRRAHLIVLSPGDACRAANIHPGWVPPIVIGANSHPTAQLLQDAGLFENPDMAAIVGKERGGGNHEHAIWLVLP